MPHKYTEAQTIEYENSMPRKRTGVMTALFNGAGEVLVVEPSYKPGWNLVGGIVEADESPLMAAVRETHEEIGLLLDPSRFALAGVQYLSPRTTSDFLRVLFKLQLTDAEAAAITLQVEEITASKFVAVDELAGYPERSPMRAIHQVLTAGPGVGYVENANLKTS